MEKDWKFPAIGVLADWGGDGETRTEDVADEASDQLAHASSVANSGTMLP